MRWTPITIAFFALVSLPFAWSFEPDMSPQPAKHPPLSPEDGAVANTNPPSMIWRLDDRAATYTLEMSQSPDFEGEVIHVEGIDMPFYNHSEVLDAGTWHWRYLVVTDEGEVSEPSAVKSFTVAADTPEMPVPPTDEIIENIPDHPRIFVTPDTLDEFRARRETVASEAWQGIEARADASLDVSIPELDLQPMPDDPGTSRKQVFYLVDGEPRVPAGFKNTNLRDASYRAGILSMAWQISGEEHYAEAAREWALFAAPFRMDYHLEDRGQHDTVVYNNEQGLKNMALAYDRLYHRLSEDERAEILDHIIYHSENAIAWTRDRLKLHLNYQNSHGQQCMHALLTTVLAVADETEQTREWADWLIRQYVNRDAWGSDDGGYSEGQTYGHKFKDILEGLAALTTVTDIDVFKRPRLRNAGRFWMYCMSLNYWWNHWGDVYSLLMTVPGSSSDTYIAGFIASMTDDPYVTWWSDTVLGNPRHVPLWYLSSTGIEPKPPVDIAQARLFPDVGQLAAYDRFYDHRSNRIFFRSSPFGGHSHAHADQNGFVIHTGGEIMAVDAGYYTHYGDDYHAKWSRITPAHNTILVNGEGQPKSIDAKGHFTSFLNSADYSVFTGDAAEAYPDVLEQFDRTVIFIRPDIFIVRDELQAVEPSTFDWLLNTFEEAEIDEDAQTMIVGQMDQRLRVQHVAPEGLTYTQSNERPYPILTEGRDWSRYTEAFPQPYHIRATTGEAERAQILAVMDAYDETEGPALEALEQIDAEGALAVQLVRDGLTETVLFRNADADSVAVDGMETDARAASVARDAQGDVVRWMVQGATRLAVDGTELFSAQAPCDVAAQLPSPGAAALVQVKPSAETELSMAAPAGAVFAAPPDAPEQAAAVDARVADGRATLTLGEETVLWIDPAIDLTAQREPLAMTVTDGDGQYTLDLQTAIADNGEIVAWASFVDPREQGVYDFEAGGARILVQDRWDQTLSADGASSLTAPWREAAEIFVRYAPGNAPNVTATVRDSYRGQLVNLLRNGSFEEGSPDYPPRTWTVWHPRDMGHSWPFWSQEDATEGESCLKFVRAETPMTIKSQPMRLRTAGTYLLRFMARGDATTATVKLSGQYGSGVEIPLEPSEDWREYEAEVEMEPGYTLVNIIFGSGGEDEQVLWLDDMQFGRVEG
ncbi:MAG: DUF4962 domain-containing protein [Armatimonadota bacterium]